LSKKSHDNVQLWDGAKSQKEHENSLFERDIIHQSAQNAYNPTAGIYDTLFEKQNSLQ
jgi:hypothetical protein